MPEAGGEYVYLSRLFHPAIGFLSGWVSFFVGFSAPIAASSLGCSEYLAVAFPNLFEWGNPDLLKKLLALAIIAAFMVIHLRGFDLGAKVQNYLTVGKVLLIAMLIIVGFAVGRGTIDNLKLGSGFVFDFSGLKTIGLSLMWIMFAYSGWNASAYIGSEIRDPEKNLPLSLLAGTGAVMILYVLLNLLFIFSATPSEMSGVIAIGSLTAGNLFGESIQNMVSVLISFALLSSISAFIILGPRVYYAMARKGHFFRIAGEIHPVFNAPSKSVILQCVIAMVMVLTGTFDQILTYLGFSLGIFPLFAVAGVFKLRRSGTSAIRMPLYPIVPAIYLVISASILFLAFFERPIESSLAIGAVISGIPAYYLFVRKSATLNVDGS
jgi:APA family basic amino acid/polyamine antiporter